MKRVKSTQIKIAWPKEIKDTALHWESLIPPAMNISKDPFYHKSEQITPKKFEHSSNRFHFSKYIESKNEFISIVADEMNALNNAQQLPDDSEYLQPTLEKLMEAGVHLGHHSSQFEQRANPFIFGKRFDAHIIDLEKTLVCLKRAMMVAQEISSMGGIILFIGTREFISRQIYEAAKSTKQFFIQHDQPWSIGTLTNSMEVLRKSIATDGSIFRYPSNQTWGRGSTGPIGPLEAFNRKSQETETLQSSDTAPPQVLLPDLIIILDGCTNEMALREAQKMNVPTISIVDTNMNPDLVTYPIPGNDDSLQSVGYILNCLVASIKHGKARLDNIHSPIVSSATKFSKYLRNKPNNP